MKTQTRTWIGAVLLAAALAAGVWTATVAAQGLSKLPQQLGTAEEMDAVEAVDRRKFVRARELAQSVLDDDPESIPGLFAMASALHYGDGNLPQGTYLIRQARKLLEARAGKTPRDEINLYWYRRIIDEQISIAGDMDRREDQLRALKRRDEVFEPRPADHIWAMIKLERWMDARRQIRKAMNHSNLGQVFRAMNGLCALEFEMRNREAGYLSCKAMADRFDNNEVAWSNTAESALTALRHEEAETHYLKATGLVNNSYGSPWRSLAMIYLLEGRVTEALSALKRAQKQRQGRPSYTHQQDQASMDTAVGSLMIALGRGQDAERLGRRVFERPDRAGGTSASGEQIKMTGTLLFWNALRMRTAQLREADAAKPWYQRLRPSTERRALELENWTVGRRAIAMLANEARLTELLRPHLLGIVNIEIWMIASSMELLGPGVAQAAIEEARKAEESYPGTEGYFKALEAEVALHGGDEERALELAQEALDLLPRAEVLLRARVAAIGGKAADEMGREKRRNTLWDHALEDFPAIFRLMDYSLPVTVKYQDNDLAEDIADALLRSPRFHSEDAGLTIKITTQEDGARLCLYRAMDALHGCTTVKAQEDDEDDNALTVRASSQFHDYVMSPKLDLSQADVRSLDGSLATGRAREQVDKALDSLAQ